MIETYRQIDGYDRDIWIEMDKLETYRQIRQFNLRHNIIQSLCISDIQIDRQDRDIQIDRWLRQRHIDRQIRQLNLRYNIIQSLYFSISLYLSWSMPLPLFYLSFFYPFVFLGQHSKFTSKIMKSVSFFSFFYESVNHYC